MPPARPPVQPAPPAPRKKPANTAWVIGLILVLGVVVGGVIYLHPSAAPPSDVFSAPPAVVEESAGPLLPPLAPDLPPAPDNATPAARPDAVMLTEVLNNPQMLEHVGRVALASVGTSPEAVKVWLFAINNPALAPNTRKNLIEDLNEDGFSDPKNPTAEDLPLIEARIALIERLAPEATDAVNTAAFKEAYKDLVNLRTKLLSK